MNWNWMTFALKVPMLIAGAMQIVQRIKSATGQEKKQAVLDAVPESIELIEFGVGRDVLDDQAIKDLMSVYIDAEKVAMKAKAALTAGILARAAAPVPAVTP